MLRRVHYIFYCHWLDYLISCFHNLDPRCSLMSNHYLGGCWLCWLFCIHFCWWHWRSIGEMKKIFFVGSFEYAIHFGKLAWIKRFFLEFEQKCPNSAYISFNLIVSAFGINVSVAFFWRHWYICHILKHKNQIIWNFEFWWLLRLR